MIVGDLSVWFIENFLKMPQWNRKYPSWWAKRRKKENMPCTKTQVL